jgi:hypothetical protein
MYQILTMIIQQPATTSQVVVEDAMSNDAWM